MAKARIPLFVIPAQAGIQPYQMLQSEMSQNCDISRMRPDFTVTKRELYAALGIDRDYPLQESGKFHLTPLILHLFFNQTVYVRIDYAETGLRSRAKQAGAKWDAQAGRWRMAHKVAVKLGLTDRIEPIGVVGNGSL